MKIADKLGITLIGGVRGRKMYVYANGERVVERTPEAEIFASSSTRA